jgi:hypothetical protein
MFSWEACGQLEGTSKTEEEWDAMSIKERARLGVARCRTNAPRAKAAVICLDEWMKLSNEEKNSAEVGRMWTWKVCGELVGTGKTEVEWNALPLDERMKLGVERMWTWKICGELEGTGKTEREWNALPLDKRMKLGAAVRLRTDAPRIRVSTNG